MIKLLWDLLIGNWCKHEWESVRTNTITRMEESADHVYQVERQFILLQCKKCGKLVTKVI